MSACVERGLPLDLDQLNYIIGQINLFAGRKWHGMALGRNKLFAYMARNTQDVTANCQIPADQVMRVDLQVGI